MNRPHRRSTPHAPQPIKATPLLAALILAGLASPVAAVNRTWDGSVDNDWNVAGNWNPAGVPGAGDRAIVTTGSPDLFSNAIIDALAQTGGVLGGTGTLTVSGTPQRSTPAPRAMRARASSTATSTSTAQVFALSRAGAT